MDSITIHYPNRTLPTESQHKNPKGQTTWWKQETCKVLTSFWLISMNPNIRLSKSNLFQNLDNLSDRQSIETIIYLFKPRINRLSLVLRLKKINMVRRKQYILVSTCLKIKTSGKCISSLMLTMILLNKKKEITNGKSILLTLGSEKFKKMLFITKCIKLCHPKAKIKSFPKLSSSRLM